MKIVFISYNYLPGYTSPRQWVNRIKPSAVIMEALSHNNTVSYVGQIGYTGNYVCNGVQYYFLEPNKKFHFPRRFHSFIKQLNPDVVVVPGFHFPLQVIQLRWRLGEKVKIILEHHADKPSTGFKKVLQKIAGKYVDAYHFTSMGNAAEWLDAKIISNKNKCYEIPANSSYFSRLDKEQSKRQLLMSGFTNFLWVGRLEKNKDPLTVLNGFEKYLPGNPSARLHMIYQTEELLPEMEKIIRGNPLLSQSVFLHGHIPHHELATWYSAADFYISGSHKEGGSIALLEAMSCGCIPIVTTIPAALKVIEKGKYGLYYEAGNTDNFFEKLLTTATIDKNKLSADVEIYFKENLSPGAIAKRFTSLLST
ncbi:MAG: hypothetical protein JWN83_27 [Chitinophagaceae bacterium]|nr:hypothetical protein [Chitinophagaceae bacterium]